MKKFSSDYYLYKSIFIMLTLTGCKKWEFKKQKSLMIEDLTNPEIAAIKRMPEYKKLQNYFER